MPTLVRKIVGQSTTTSASEQRPHHQHQQERQWPTNERQEQPQQRHKSSWPNASPVVVPFHHHQSALAAATNSALHGHTAATAAHSFTGSGAQPAAAARPMHAQQAVPYHYHHRQDRHFGHNYSSFEYSSSLHHQHQPWHPADHSHGAGMSHHHHYQKPPPQHPLPNVTPSPIHHAPGTDESFSNISDLVIQEQIDRLALEVCKAQSTRYKDSRGEISRKMPPNSLVATGPYAPVAHPSPQSLIHPSVSGCSYGMDDPTTTGNKHHSPFHREQEQHPRAHAQKQVHVHVHVHPKVSKKKARSTEKSASPTTTSPIGENEEADGDTLQYDFKYDIPPGLGQSDEHQPFVPDDVVKKVKKIVLSRTKYSKETAKAASKRTKVLSKKKLPTTKKGTRPSTTLSIPMSPMLSHRKNKEAASAASSKKKKGTSPLPTTKTTTTIRAAVNTEGVALKQGIPLGLGRDDRKFLDDYHCFIRNSCIEVFSATTRGVVGKGEAPQSVNANQVGLRCRFCAYSGWADRKRRKRCNSSIVFPKKVCNIYNLAAKMGYRHFPICPDMPPDIRERYNVLKAAKFPSKRGAMQHWIESAHALGLVDTEVGIRMMRPVASPESQAETCYDSSFNALQVAML